MHVDCQDEAVHKLVLDQSMVFRAADAAALMVSGSLENTTHKKSKG